MLTMNNQPDRHGHYTLSDGSRIYSSRTRPGSYFLWLRGPDATHKGRKYTTGDILLNKRGIVYFRTPDEALNAAKQAKT